MREPHLGGTPSRFSRHRTLITALAVILVGGAAFAAVGGVEAVKRVFVNVTIQLTGPDGESYEYVTLQPFEVENGQASATLTIDEDMGSIVLDGLGDTVPTDESGIVQGEVMATVTIDSASAGVGEPDAERTVELSMTLNTGDEPIAQEAILAQIADADVMAPWIDADGDERALYVVRGTDGTEPVLRVFGTRWLDDGEEVFDVIGMMTGDVVDGVEVVDVVVDENGLVTMTLLAQDGAEQRVAFSGNPGQDDIQAEAIQVTIHEPE
jgi:hypothetical protein